MDKAIFSWLLSMQSQNVPISAAMIQEKALTFSKELNVENFQVVTTLEGKKPNNFFLRLYQGNWNMFAYKWLMGGGKRLFQLFY